jgi:hypothetical protein
VSELEVRRLRLQAARLEMLGTLKTDERLYWIVGFSVYSRLLVCVGMDIAFSRLCEHFGIAVLSGHGFYR